MGPRRALAYAQRNRPRFVEELKEFVRFPSVSSQPHHARDVRRCATWLAAQLRRIGLDGVQSIATRGHPIVYGAWTRAPDKPTLLIYGHYDVQPADPEEEWESPPFAPAIRGNDLFGRGACDDKGQLLAQVKALECWLKTAGALPLNVRCLFEGEEEMGGGPNFAAFVGQNRRALRADAAVMSDTRMLGPNRPALTYAQRGMVRFALEVFGPREDLHSGNFGGAVMNPVQALCQILNGMHSSDGRVAIPGFYDRVRAWSERERAFMARSGPRDEEILRDAGVKAGWGEQGFTLYERLTLRPALTLNGISGGYTGPGLKASIPAKASARVSIRTVPDQQAREVEEMVRKHVEKLTPPGVTVRLRLLGSSEPAVVDRGHPALRAASAAYRLGFGVRPVLLRSGGSIPAVSLFREELGIPTSLMGFALPTDRIHAANERFHLPNFYRGIDTCIWNLTAAAALLRRGRSTDRAARATPR